MLLAAGVVLAADRGLVSPTFALHLHVLPNLVLGVFCATWLAAGHVSITPSQVVLQGWAKVLYRSGRMRREYVRRHIPRSQWHTLQVSGLLLATLTWTHDDETIVLQHLGQPYLLRCLLHPERRSWSCSSLTQRLYTRRARGLGLLRTFALLRIVFHAGVTFVGKLYPEAVPRLELAVRRCLRRARRLFCALRERPVRIVRRTPRFEELANPSEERAWFARLLKDVETSTLNWRPPAHTRAPVLARRTQ
jgi:hypothetical protein